MSIRNLDRMFQPRSIAVIGASERPHSVGATVFGNILRGGFGGPVYPVNPRYRTLSGRACYQRVADLPQAPDLAVICTLPSTIPRLIAELGEQGCRAAVVLTAGLSQAQLSDGRSVRQAMLEAAKPWLLRILGPNCVGLLLPCLGLNASFAHCAALPGKIAFVSQSGGMVTGVLDWACTRGIGFSRFISLGDSSDVDFGDVLDYLASDTQTEAILLYMEDVRNARKFMSAARAAARAKPVVVLKAGRVAEGARAATTHTGALAGADAVYDAAFRRAGLLRVLSTGELLDAAATLAHATTLRGARLAILTNGGGPGVMATDALVAGGGKLAQLAPETLAALDQLLPPTWSHANPVDIIGDASAERYRQALEVVQRDQGADAVLVMHAPTAIVDPQEVAAAVVQAARPNGRSTLCCWFGGDGLGAARRQLGAGGLPVFDTPESAVEGFLQMMRYRQAQQLLMEAPCAGWCGAPPQRAAAQALIRDAVQSGRSMLSEPEAKQLLACYGIPVVETGIADRVEAAVLLAGRIGFPVALKILSPDITHKTDVGGVALDLSSEDEVRSAAIAMRERLHAVRPQAHMRGFTVQAMARRPGALELIVGAASDPVFGPVVLFGQGGVAVETIGDRAVALPPLNSVLAQDLIGHARVAKLMAGYRDRLPANSSAVSDVLVRISVLLADLPEVLEMEINPLLADHQGVIALDARMHIGAAAASGTERFAIRPYPVELEEHVSWQGCDVTLRPIRPEDAPQHTAFFNALDPEDVRFRMFTGMRTLSPSQLARFTQIDYDREMAFIATRHNGSRTETLGVARAVSDPDRRYAEFAVLVRSDLKGKGLGTALMQKLIAYCRQAGVGEMVGDALPDNHRMHQLARKLGFSVAPLADSATRRMCLQLATP